MNRGRGRQSRRLGAGGFSLIEVLIALLVLAFGLLGFALLQTTGLRFTQSANYRTQATNLAYDLLDQMRSNRFQAAWYAGSAGAGFNAGEVTDTACSRDTGTVSLAQNVARWQCQVARALGEDASAEVNYVNGLVTVTLSWSERIADDPQSEVTVRTQL
ncbi:type IV pilus modification protein PilV [Coralloluteibacterium stylophorae]|uniref:Type IV pilus modification protein PilV n=1 Tax=Coralloluteibacterium stylophorae TaxID=1776034 RepID=A0A8J7VWA6_9GAMM|nr:type IV pilus modification protein PilV [Coralloluteibacterium stylophorae]MBS7456665.1 type IV pilus modification protein PilV [Coralloluteibacterium stylophorae]